MNANSKLWTPSKKWFYFAIPLGGFLALGVGVLMVLGFNFSTQVTSTEEFCVSCHEMNAFAYEEFKTTQHYKSRSGVTATCVDCHLPREFIPKMVRKIGAVREVYHHLLGSYSTEETYNAHRREMAEQIWERMKDNDSKACRYCHNEERWDLAKQGKNSSNKHGQARKDKIVAKGKEPETCIDCHKGLAHEMPD